MITARATEAAGNVSPMSSPYTLRFDSQPAQLQLSGPLWDARGTTLQPQTYQLTARGVDAGQSGARWVAVSVDGQLRAAAETVPGVSCPDTAGACEVSYNLDAFLEQPGAHTIRVETADGTQATPTVQTFTVVTPDEATNEPALDAAIEEECPTPPDAQETDTWTCMLPLTPDEGVADPRASLRSRDFGYDKNWTHTSSAAYGGYQKVGFQTVRVRYGTLRVQYHVGLDRRAADPGDDYSMPAEIKGTVIPTSGPKWQPNLRARCVYVDGDVPCYDDAVAYRNTYSYDPLNLDELFPFELGHQYYVSWRFSGVAEGRGPFSWRRIDTPRFTCRTTAASDPDLRRRCTFNR